MKNLEMNPSSSMTVAEMACQNHSFSVTNITPTNSHNASNIAVVLWLMWQSWLHEVLIDDVLSNIWFSWKILWFWTPPQTLWRSVFAHPKQVYWTCRVVIILTLLSLLALEFVMRIIQTKIIYCFFFFLIFKLLYDNKKLQQTTKNTFGPGTHFPDDQSIRI